VKLLYNDLIDRDFISTENLGKLLSGFDNDFFDEMKEYDTELLDFETEEEELERENHAIELYQR